MDSTGVTQPGVCNTRLAPPDTMHAVSVALRDRLHKNGYCPWFVAEYDDEQRFRIGAAGNQQYGPFAGVYATPWLANYTSSRSFTAFWVNVAFVHIDTTSGASLPPAYQRLQLEAGDNCMFVHYNDTTAVWQAAVMGPNSSGVCAQEDVPNPPITARPIDIAIDPQSATPGQLPPPVTRFIEGNADSTFVGVRCGDQWCVLGASSAGEIPAPSHGGFNSASSRSKGKGWFDDQHLGFLPQIPKPKITMSNQTASIIPADNLGGISLVQYKSKWQFVATVYMHPKLVMPGKYSKSAAAQGYGLRGKDNRLWIRDSVAPSGTETWQATFGKRPGNQRYPVTMTPHPYYVPPTARWRWRDDDEQMWVACMQGCCMVRAGNN